MLTEFARARASRAPVLTALTTMRQNRFLLFVLALVISGCASTGENVVPDAANQDAVSYLFTTCGGKYDFSQDCSNFNGAKRKILVGGVKCRVAGSSDGRMILLQGIAKYFPTARTREMQVNECYPLIKQILIDKTSI